MRHTFIVIAVATVAVVVAGAIGSATATPRSQEGTAALNKKLFVIDQKLGSLRHQLDRQTGTLKSEVEKSRSEANSKFFAIEHAVTNIQYDTTAIRSCVQHLNGNVGSCAP
jgi:hypothetical protein